MPPVKPPKSYECPILEAKLYQNLLSDPFIQSQADIAQELGVIRARVSQVMEFRGMKEQIQGLSS